MNIIGIIGAMESEIEQLKELMEVEEVTHRASMDFYRGVLFKHPVVVVKSGVCKVNAAVCVQLLKDEFDVCAVINTGIAGSLDARIDIGDLVISTDVVHHDVNAAVFGYEPGCIPQLGKPFFEADKSLVQTALMANETANSGLRAFCGRIASGEYFVSRNEDKRRIKDTFGALCVEMEGAAIAQAAWLNQLPFVIIRAISDKADDSAVMAYNEFEELAIAHSVGLVKEFIKLL